MSRESQLRHARNRRDPEQATFAKNRADAGETVVLEREGDEIRTEAGDLRNEDHLQAADLVVAMDGPAAAGKSTVARELARRIDALLFDTGVIYRALALLSLERGIDPSDAVQLATAAEHMPVRVEPATCEDGRACDVWLDSRDVTWAIRAPEVDRVVSAVSAHREVRDALLQVQRDIGHHGRVVMVGRDIGTVVMPDADLKIWLDASLGERARRRVLDLARLGKPHDFEEVRRDMATRDGIDSDRAVSPMKPAPDAVTVNTDGLTVEQVVDRIVGLLRERVNREVE